MEPKGNPKVSGDSKINQKTASSSATGKSNGKAIDSSPTVSSAPSIKSKAAIALCSAPADQMMLFRDVSLGPHEAELMFRLIHFWEARNPISKTLIRQEMLLIDQEDNVIQGFVPATRVGTYKLTPGCVYKLTKFFGSRNKTQYSVADHIATVSFSCNSKLSVVPNPPVAIGEDRFRFHSYKEFQTHCDAKGDLYDFVGHMKLVNGEAITEHTILDEVAIAEKRHLCVHVQKHDEPVMKLYIWDNLATDFCQKFKTYGRTPSVILVTTLNPRHLGGTLSLSTMSSSRVFMDTDVQPTKDYLEWLGSNSDIANKVNAEVVTKPETVTLEELFSYIKMEDAKVAWFECTATIDDVIQGSAWYYLSCGGCNSKAVKGPTSLICENPKCKKKEVTGVPQYLTKISVYDKSEQAVFMILGDAGKELTGKHAAELVANYFECNEGVTADHCVPVPQALLDAIGQTRKFIVKVSAHNLTGKIQSITATKILPPDTPQPVADLEDFTTPATSDGVLKTCNEASGPSIGLEDSTGARVRKASEKLGTEEAKRCKNG